MCHIRNVKYLTNKKFILNIILIKLIINIFQEKQTVWVSCEGETPTDVEYLGPVKYYPNIQGFPGYYFPYVNSEGYLSPLVAVHFVQPKRKYLMVFTDSYSCYFYQ